MLSYVDNFLLDRAPLAPRFAILLTRRLCEFMKFCDAGKRAARGVPIT